MRTNTALTLTLPVEQVRAALVAHDEHEALEQAIHDFDLSPDELERLRKANAEATDEAMWQAEDARRENVRQREWIAANLRHIAEGHSASFPSAWFYARAYRDLRRDEGDADYDTDSLQNWMEVVKTGVSQHSVEDVRHAIQILADCASPLRGVQYVTAAEGQSR